MRRTTTSADAIQTHRRLGGVCELFVDANQFVFQVRQESLYRVLYQTQRRGRTSHHNRPYLI